MLLIIHNYINIKKHAFFYPLPKGTGHGRNHDQGSQWIFRSDHGVHENFVIIYPIFNGPVLVVVSMTVRLANAAEK